MSLLSNREAHLVGDISDEISRAIGFMAGFGESEFCDDLLRIYAVEKAVMNAIETCIRLQRKNVGRFERLFPGFDFDALRSMGNRLRHDYGNVDAHQLWFDLQGVLPRLCERAEDLLSAHRRALCGQD